VTVLQRDAAATLGDSGTSYSDKTRQGDRVER
jgi:hypothetical protein